MERSRTRRTRRCLHNSLYILLAFSLGACSTIRQQKEAELEVVTRARVHSETFLAGLRSGTVPPREYDLHVYFSYDILNEALSSLDGFQFQLPNDPSVTIDVHQIRIASTGALPTTLITAAAQRGALRADLDVGLVLS
jgi:hypothetical protein